MPPAPRSTASWSAAGPRPSRCYSVGRLWHEGFMREGVPGLSDKTRRQGTDPLRVPTSSGRSS